MPRTLEEWRKEVNDDMLAIVTQLSMVAEPELDDELRARSFACAAKEARRLQSDIYRIADELFDIDRKTIDAIHT